MAGGGVPKCFTSAFLYDFVDVSLRIWIGSAFHNFVVAGTKEL